jgi:hypothetical protein
MRCVSSWSIAGWLWLLSSGGVCIAQETRELTEEEHLRTRVRPESRVTQPPAVSAHREFREFRLPPNFRKRMISSSLPAPPGGRDSDGDNLTDAEEYCLHTDPCNKGTDGDALLDGWEVHPVNGVDLHAMGASPLHKDVYIEMDFMTRASATNGLGWNQLVLDAIESTFKHAPVDNPDGVPGIAIHLVPGNEVPHDPDLSPAATEFLAIKNTHFADERAPMFHYMIWADGYDGGTSSGQAFSIPNADFIVTLGKWNGQTGGTDEQKIGTFIHELGHNLGLRHGSIENVNRKPNHLSVMSYSFQVVGILYNAGRVFDYQRFPVAALDESALVENAGLGKTPELAGYHTIHSFLEVPAWDWIDWNMNAADDPAAVSLDLNGDFTTAALMATPNEWKAIVYDGGEVGYAGDIAQVRESRKLRVSDKPMEELTEEMSRDFERQMRRK